MKTSKDKQVRNSVRRVIPVIIFLLGLILLSSCRDRLVINREKMLNIDAIGSNDLYSYRTISPPKPDTHLISRLDFSKYGEIEVDYYSVSLKSIENMAYLMGKNDQILSSVKPVSYGKPSTFTNGTLYHMKAVFPMDKTGNLQLMKVTIPNTPSFPEGNETFFIKIE